MRDEYMNKAKTNIGEFGGQPMPDMKAPCVPDRQSAKAALEDHIYRLRQEARQLEALHNALPTVLPIEADEALWKIIATVSGNKFR